MDLVPAKSEHCYYQLRRIPTSCIQKSSNCACVCVIEYLTLIAVSHEIKSSAVEFWRAPWQCSGEGNARIKVGKVKVSKIPVGPVKYAICLVTWKKEGKWKIIVLAS